MEEPRGLPSMGSHRVGHNWSNLTATAGIFKEIQHKCSNPREHSSKLAIKINCWKFPTVFHPHLFPYIIPFPLISMLNLIPITMWFFLNIPHPIFSICANPQHSSHSSLNLPHPWNYLPPAWSDHFCLWYLRAQNHVLSFNCFCDFLWASFMAQVVKNLSAMQETLVWYLSQEDSLEKNSTIHTSSVLPT